MDHIFGPVNSRRLGRSLGIDLLSEKICNLNCIYCEVGATTQLTCERGEYVPTVEIIAEIDAYFADADRLAEIDVVTVTASGEPTLHSGFGKILVHLKETAGKPLAVLTNGTTLMDAQVREELALADVVVPSLDAARVQSFRKLNRPATCLDLEEIIQGLLKFSHEYKGKLWLEILFARGINDSDEDVRALLDVISRMRVDRIQLNTVARPPLESFAKPVSEQRLQEIVTLLRKQNSKVPVDLLAQGAPTKDTISSDMTALAQQDIVDEIVQMLKRRPCTAADINKIFHCGGLKKVEQYLAPLVRAGKIHTRSHGDRLYYLL
jgi:wyosine [tRNA(Phe)-imidazoG37] synthetase (radical SAM superfamily)